MLGAFGQATLARNLARESLEGGKLRHESGRVLQELLDFADLTAAEVMVPRVHIVGIPLEASREEIVELVVSSPHTRYPVYREDIDDVVGILHVKDVLRLLSQSDVPDGYPLRPVPYVPETADVDVVLAAMRREHTQLAIILDEHGGTAGLVSIEDLFEEVVGEIEEEAEPKPGRLACAAVTKPIRRASLQPYSVARTAATTASAASGAVTSTIFPSLASVSGS